MSQFENTIKRLLENNQFLQKGYINGNIVEINSEIINDIEILGNVTSGECLIVTTTDTKEKIAIPTKFITSSKDSKKEIERYRRGKLIPNSPIDYDYCLIYSYVNLEYNPSEDDENDDDEEKDTINTDVNYALRSNRIITKAPEAPKNMLHLQKIDPSYYGTPLYRHPYYPTKGDAINNENGIFFTGDVLNSQGYAYGEYLIDLYFQNDIVRTVNYGVDFDLQRKKPPVYNPLVPIPPSLIYQWALNVNLNNIIVSPDATRIGEKVLRFKFSDKYEVELLKLHPYEIYKTYINQLDENKFEVVVKAGIKIDYEGFPNDEYNMKNYYDDIQNENYIEFSNHFSEKEEEKLEFVYEQLYCFKWCKGFYFIVEDGEIKKNKEFEPLDDYKSFDYSIFEQDGDGIYDKIYACSYAGNWDKYDKDGNQLITKDYYGNDLKYKNHIIFDKGNNLNQEEPFTDKNGEFVEREENDENLIAVLPQIISLEYGNMYIPLNKSQLRKNTKIYRLYNSAEFIFNNNDNAQELDIIDSYLDVDYGYNNLNSLEQKILGKNNKLNILSNNTVPLIFSNLHNNVTLKNSTYDYNLQFFVDYPYNMSIFKNVWVYKKSPVTMDYFPKDRYTEIKRFDSKKKPWDFDYYGGENDYPENKDKQAKLEFKLVNKDKIDIKEGDEVMNNNFKIKKFEITQKDLSNVNSRSDLEKEKFHVDNIYICEI